MLPRIRISEAQGDMTRGANAVANGRLRYTHRMDTGFSQVLGAIERTDAASFNVVVPPDWLQGRTVFGGLQMALAVRAMRAVLPLHVAGLPLRSAQMTFVGPLLGGTPIQMRAEALRVGKSTVHARCDLQHDDGKLACTAVGIFGGPRESYFVREMPRRTRAGHPRHPKARLSMSRQRSCSISRSSWRGAHRPTRVTTSRSR